MLRPLGAEGTAAEFARRRHGEGVDHDHGARSLMGGQCAVAIQLVERGRGVTVGHVNGGADRLTPFGVVEADDDGAFNGRVLLEDRLHAPGIDVLSATDNTGALAMVNH